MLDVKRIRRGRGYTQVQLAAKAEVDPATLSRIERGVADPNLSTLRRIAEALNVSVPDLFDTDPDESPDVEERRETVGSASKS